MNDATLIKNGRLVNDGCITEADILIRNGRIERIDREIAVAGAVGVVDATGLFVLPGLIDDQVHFREPGLTHKGTIRSESQAAIAGGITTYMDMPNTKPQTVTIDALEQKYAMAEGRSFANYSFYLGATNDNLEELRALRPDQTCGIKVFMGASTGNMLVDRVETLEGIFRHAPTLVATHCEDTPTIERNEAEYRARYGEDVPMRCHPEIRSAEACYLSSSLAVELAKRHGTRLHVLHLTTERELELFETIPLEEKRITAEVCVHHLYFDDREYDRRGSWIKCNPAIKGQTDRDALRRALVEGRIDVIGTDHAPHTLDEKANSYFKAPSGLPLVQHTLPMLMEFYHEGWLSLENLVERGCHAPARLFGIKERGYLREGYWADLVLVDPSSPNQVCREDILYKCGWSPIEGVWLRSRVLSTFVNGSLVYDQGVVQGREQGMRVEFSR